MSIWLIALIAFLCAVGILFAVTRRRGWRGRDT
jgi:hypothetical protein